MKRLKRKESPSTSYGQDASGVDIGSMYVPKKPNRSGVLAFGTAMFVLGFAAVFIIYAALSKAFDFSTVVIALVFGSLCAMSFHIALDWEKVVVLRFGKVSRVAGPGFFVTVPILEYSTVRVDQRTIATPFTAERTLTADLVPVNIDAALYWMVRDARQACTEVEDYYASITLLAQAALREAVGRSTVAEVALRRDELDVEIKDDIEHLASEWGVDIIRVKVRDIIVPQELQDVMSLEAQAEREANARMTVAAAEADLAEMLKATTEMYGDPDAAMKIRAMLMQYETVKKSGSSVVTVPTAVSNGFVNQGKESLGSNE